MTVGCGGRKLSSVKHTQPDWLEYAEREYGYGRLRVDGDEGLSFEYVHSESGEVWDTFDLAPKSDMRSKNCNTQAARSDPELLQNTAADKKGLPGSVALRLIRAAGQYLPLNYFSTAVTSICAAFRQR